MHGVTPRYLLGTGSLYPPVDVAAPVAAPPSNTPDEVPSEAALRRQLAWWNRLAVTALVGFFVLVSVPFVYFAQRPLFTPLEFILMGALPVAMGVACYVTASQAHFEKAGKYKDLLDLHY